ncbi:MAG: ABC transporter permease, partial [Ruminococcus sp.]
AVEHYNEKVKDADKISYTDYIALLMSSVTTIVNVISYVLIAFVAVSLIVSSIMIGIITYISVLERTKEIGILRAIGASKRNISSVFNAETGIIGLCSGLLGVGISLLILIPGNAIIHSLMGSAEVSASIPVVSGVILVVLSMLLTLIGGIIPAKKAAKKDPVTALRSE